MAIFKWHALAISRFRFYFIYLIQEEAVLSHDLFLGVVGILNVEIILTSQLVKRCLRANQLFTLSCHSNFKS